MKKIKSIAALSLAFLMMAGMAGCGNTAGGNGGDGTAANAGGDAGTSAAAADPCLIEKNQHGFSLDKTETEVGIVRKTVGTVSV